MEDFPTKKVLSDLQKEKKYRQYDKKVAWIKDQNALDMEEERENEEKYRMP